MTTPESLEVMLLSPRVPHRWLFSDLRAVIIDEVHALAGTDRGAHLMAVLERLARYALGDVQRACLSATVGNPEASPAIEGPVEQVSGGAAGAMLGRDGGGIPVGHPGYNSLPDHNAETHGNRHHRR